jgi:hypothetical protein
MLGFANARMQEGKSESEERERRRGPLYVYNDKKRAHATHLTWLKRQRLDFHLTLTA